jgi:hypothetical protein
MRRLLFLTVVGLALGIPASSAQGGYTLFLNRADFDAATSGRTTIDFEGLAPDGGSVDYPTGITLSGVHFSTTIVGDDHQAISFLALGKDTIAPGSGRLGTQQSTLDPDIVAALPGSFFAFGVYIGAFNAGARLGDNTITFTLSTGETFTLTTTNAQFLAGNLTFIGLVSTDAFTSVAMSIPPPDGGNADLVIDNFTFANGLEVVPAPSSGLLMLVGLVAILGFAARQRRRAVASA